MSSFHIVRLSHAALVWADRPLGGAVGPELHRELQMLVDEGATPLVVDLVRVPAIDDTVVAVLAMIASQAGHRGRTVELRLVGGRRFTVRDAIGLRRALAEAFPTAA
ncbi:MAG TPA: STAS domain-containing protein [Pilimelia sp.]|nr:STAS domain-containing protein [Pilimelia sp.]